MNVSMADAWNLGWKLGAVLRGTARPELLRTYSDERQAVAQELIDFDREFSEALQPAARTAVDPEEFQRYFVAQGRFTAGVATRYAPSMITAEATHQHLAEGFPVGMRFHSAPVLRLADAKPVQLGHVARADGAWRVYVFADADRVASSARALCELLASSVAARPLHAGGRRPRRRDRSSAPSSSRATASSTSTRCRRSLLPRKGVFGLIDYEKAFCPDPAGGRHLRLRGRRPRRVRRRRAARPVRRAPAAAGRARGAGGLLRRRADRLSAVSARRRSRPARRRASRGWAARARRSPGPEPGGRRTGRSARRQRQPARSDGDRRVAARARQGRIREAGRPGRPLPLDDLTTGLLGGIGPRALAAHEAHPPESTASARSRAPARATSSAPA